MEIYRAKFSVKLLNRDEGDALRLLPYVMDFISVHGDPPVREAIIHDFGGKGRFKQPTTKITWLIEKFRERYKRNQAKAVASRVANLVVSDPDEAIKVATREFGDIQRTASDRSRELNNSDWGQALSDYRERIESGKLDGITFGYEAMDKLLGGIRDNYMAFVVGRPKWYKSWQLLKSAVGAMYENVDGTFISAELGEVEMYSRFQCMVAGVNYNRFQHGKMTKEEWQLMHEAEERITDDSVGKISFIHPPHDQRTVPELSAEARQRDAQIVWMDQFRFITPLRTFNKKHDEMESTVYDIKAACEHNPWFVAAQFNREAASLTEMADLAQIGLTDAIGQASDIVLGLFRNRDMAESDLLQYGVVASRGFQSAIWNVKVELTKHSNFRIIDQKMAA
jgi:hypothetical protein